MKELIEYLAKCLVDKPEDVVVQEVAGEMTTVYELRVAGGELGQIIGKHGHTIRAIRTVERGVEIEVHSTHPFPVRALPAVLRIGGEQFVRSRYAKGRLDTLIFLLSEEEFASLDTKDPVSVQYGKGKARPKPTWDFGALDKSLRVDGRSGS